MPIKDRDDQDDYDIRRTFKKVKRYSVWLAFILIGLLGLSFAIVISWMSVLYIKNIVNDKVAIQDFLLRVFYFILTILATLAVEHFVNPSKKSWQLYT